MGETLQEKSISWKEICAETDILETSTRSADDKKPIFQPEWINVGNLVMLYYSALFTSYYWPRIIYGICTGENDWISPLCMNVIGIFVYCFLCVCIYKMVSIPRDFLLSLNRTKDFFFNSIGQVTLK